VRRKLIYSMLEFARIWKETPKLDLVDEFRLFVSPVVLGRGTPYFPALDERLDLELVETRTFGSRVVYVRYRRASRR
jgi:dihydrofolate reductase